MRGALHRRRPRVAGELLHQVGEEGVGRHGDLLTQPLEHMAAPFREIGDARRQPLRVQADAQHIDRRLKEHRIGARHQGWRGAVGRHQCPVPVDGEGRVGLVPLEHEVDGFAGRLEGRIGERPLGKTGA